ncbi:MAG TPA: cytochrome c biogenesis protein [Oligoflexia bacterium]|nr:cytochrome c biogenesis protein [Oligoflexia bacterium]HMP27407.1 cytochrome c biogenesis protein [Oligoflexia bacterium]
MNKKENSRAAAFKFKPELISTYLLPALLFLSFPFIIYAHYLIFLKVPNEKIMGAVQRIFYFHVGAATSTYLIGGILLIASISYLLTSHKIFNALNIAAAEVALLLASITLISGSIWGHSAWNTWFRWEPRLVSFLILWFILLSLCFFRRWANPDKAALQSAVLGIVAAMMIPIVIYSIKLFPNLIQLHPIVVEKGGLRDQRFIYALSWSILAFAILSSLLLSFRALIEILEQDYKIRDKNG